ncbi:peptidase M50 [Jiulongibacter sediminis]|uniref:Peptidase M50 n=1 Tax=Jiulongibacter sediminis TaxID=1605367 RepID=A0A0P7BYF9_9BACT|nr:peptidase M50 [Jiulongibacter sediminis]TBX26938.1 peptidase M50 [Jiulongibacter sediminis]
MEKKQKTLLIQLGLFLATVIVTTFAGMEWVTGKSVLNEGLNWMYLRKGFVGYALPFLGFLTVHEFGHYFMAKKKKVDVTLPYYIPFWFAIIGSFGTMGAFIRIKDQIKNRVNYFDIGIAGPLAGFVIALAALIYGYSTMPGTDFVFDIHPEYEQYGADYGKYVYDELDEGLALRVGDSFLSGFIRDYFGDASLLPHPNELPHYPFILAGFLGLFFTALNLMPIGQLDGGHILFSLIGEKRFNQVSPVLFTGFVFFSGLGFFTVDELQQKTFDEGFSGLFNFLLYIYFIYLCFSRISRNRKTNWVVALAVVFAQLLVSKFFPNAVGFSGFLAFSFLLGRVLGVYHPPVEDKEPLSTGRIILGWLSLLIFVLCFSPYPFY